MLDIRFIAPIGYEFCSGKSVKGDDRQPPHLRHKNLALSCGSGHASLVCQRMPEIVCVLRHTQNAITATGISSEGVKQEFERA